MDVLGDSVWDDHNEFRTALNEALVLLQIKLKSADKKAIWQAVSWRSENATAVIKKIHKRNTASDPLHGLFAVEINSRPTVVEYEPDPYLRDTEQIPLLEKGGIEAFLQREVLPYAPDAWYKPDNVKIGYEISFNRYFYKPQSIRTLEEIRTDILALEQDTESLLTEILEGVR